MYVNFIMWKFEIKIISILINFPLNIISVSKYLGIDQLPFTNMNKLHMIKYQIRSSFSFLVYNFGSQYFQEIVMG